MATDVKAVKKKFRKLNGYPIDAAGHVPKDVSMFITNATHIGVFPENALATAQFYSIVGPMYEDTPLNRRIEARVDQEIMGKGADPHDPAADDILDPKFDAVTTNVSALETLYVIEKRYSHVTNHHVPPELFDESRDATVRALVGIGIEAPAATAALDEIRQHAEVDIVGHLDAEYPGHAFTVNKPVGTKLPGHGPR